MTANVKVLRSAARPIVDLWCAVDEWDDADLLVRSRECGDDCLCSDRDEPNHDCTRCPECEQTLVARADEARCEVVAAVVAAGLAGDVAEAAGAA